MKSSVGNLEGPFHTLLRQIAGILINWSYVILAKLIKNLILFVEDVGGTQKFLSQYSTTWVPCLHSVIADVIDSKTWRCSHMNFTAQVVEQCTWNVKVVLLLLSMLDAFSLTSIINNLCFLKIYKNLYRWWCE